MFKVYFANCNKHIRKDKRYKQYFKNKNGSTLREAEDFLNLLHKESVENIEISISIEEINENKSYEFDLFIDKNEMKISILDMIEADLTLTVDLSISEINEMMKKFLEDYEDEGEKNFEGIHRKSNKGFMSKFKLKSCIKNEKNNKLEEKERADSKVLDETNVNEIGKEESLASENFIDDFE